MPAQRPLVCITEPQQLVPDPTQFKLCQACQQLLGTDTMLLSDEALALCATCSETLRAPTVRPSMGICVQNTALAVSRDNNNTRDTTSEASRLTFSRRRRTPSISNVLLNASSGESEFSSDDDSENASVDREAIVSVPSTTRQPTPTNPAIPLPVATPSLDRTHPKRAPIPSQICPSTFVEPTLSLPRPASPYRPSRTTSTTTPQLVSHSSRDTTRNADAAYPDPDPLVDITRLRIRPRGFKCLQPGATFKGVQKSGRSSYDVNVTLLVSTRLSHPILRQLFNRN